MNHREMIQPRLVLAGDRVWKEHPESRHPANTIHVSELAKAITTLKEQGRNASELAGHRSEAVIAKVYDRRRIRKAAAVE